MSFLDNTGYRATAPTNRPPIAAGLLAAVLGLAALANSAWAQSSLNLSWGASTASGVVGYRFYQGAASRSYTSVVDVGNTTSNTVNNLLVGATYFFGVTAYNSNGLESAFSNEISYTVPSSNAPPAIGAITVAAGAAALTAPFVASNGIIWQSVLTGLAGSGQATCTFTVTNAGNYSISASVNAPNQGANSFYLNVDAQPSDPAMVWDIQPPTSGFMNRTVSWRGNGTDTAPQYGTAVFSLSAGTHQLIVRGREPSAQLNTVTLTPYFAITNVAKLSTGNQSIRGSGVANATCVLQAASSLRPPVAWASIGTNVSDAQGLFACADLAATNFQSRYYRIQAR